MGSTLQIVWGKPTNSLSVLLSLLSVSPSYTHRYARWSLGFVDPPLEVSGTGNHCKISALNARGRVLLEPVMDAMNGLLAKGTVSDVVLEGGVIDVKVPPPGEVGSFNEEERSRQVGHSTCSLFVLPFCDPRILYLSVNNLTPVSSVSLRRSLCMLFLSRRCFP
jgi:hypothetical protein